MSKRYWTSDWHLGHAAILGYCGRPFKDVEHQTERIIAEANMRCNETDTLIHVGDFCTRGVARGVPGLRYKWDHYAGQVVPMLTLLEGNHDKQNKTKTIGRHLFCHIAGWQVFVSHYPTDSDVHDPALIEYVHKACAFAICGHVHEKWLAKNAKIEGLPPLLNINVGVDQHQYRPVSDDEVLNIWLKAAKGG